MRIDRFQLCIITVLAFALGLSIASQSANGYPAGASVSLGSNPLWTIGGQATSSSGPTLSAPADQDMIITDLLLSNSNGSTDVATLSTDGGDRLGQFHLSSYNSISRHVEHAFASGIRIPAGSSITLTATGTVYYSLSGYYAQP